MLSYNKLYFNDEISFLIKERQDTIDVFYAISNILNETKKEVSKKTFSKKNETSVKKMLNDTLKSNKKTSKKELGVNLDKIEKNGEIEELVDSSGALKDSSVPILDMAMHPKKTMDQTVVMSRPMNDPIRRGYRVYWGESEDKKDNIVSEVDYSDAFGYEETEDMDYKNTVNTLKKMGVEFGYEETEDMDYKNTVNTLKKMGVDNPKHRADEFGKLPNAKKIKGKLKQRLSEKEQLENAQKEKMVKMVEDIIVKKGDNSDISKKSKPLNKIIFQNIKAIKKLAEKEGVSMSELIKALKQNE